MDVRLPSPSELAEMARNGQSDRVHAILRQVPPVEWARFAGRDVLRQGIVGGLVRLRSLPLHAVAERREARAFVQKAVDTFVAWSHNTQQTTRELHRSLLDFSMYLFDQSELASAERYAGIGLESDAEAFPEIHPRLLLHRAALMSARGHYEGAEAVLRGLHDRRDLIADRRVIPELVLALGHTSLLTGRIPAFKRALFDGLASFYVGLGERRAVFDLLRRTYRGGARLLLSETRLVDKAIFAGHWLFFVGARLAGPAKRLLDRAFLGTVYLSARLRHRHTAAAWERSSSARHERSEMLVTRAMGGVGDLLMLTPGLHALSLNVGAPVALAIPRRFFPLFDGNDDVRLVDIHAELNPAASRRWYNLTDCPAAFTESLTAPRVRRGRIEIFARALGVRGRALRAMDRRPRYRLSKTEEAFREAFLADHGLTGRDVVGVQIRADESYRDYARMGELVRALARETPVLVFDDRPIAGCDHEHVVKVGGLALREAFAIASGCRVLVAPDSAFVHLSAALSIPCVALFGPTDGRVRTADYPLVRFLDARRDLRCVPCWRNEDTPCGLTNMRSSVCMGEIPVARVRDTVRGLLQESNAPDSPRWRREAGR